jgi:nucleoid DNA-binding protein
MATRGKTTGSTPSSSKGSKPKPPSKAQVLSYLAESNGLTKPQVAGVLFSMETYMAESLRHLGVYTLPGLIKISVVHKQATKDHPGRNPITGETITVKGKPARNVIRVRALKKLKDMVL